ncbi:MAG: helix-turn-helix domain-containing protein [Candidatus Diapherotrites archaeon]|nr:helix-turn-helix domain-containing protein [Candidatus Diapherotrites archaeon]
MEKLELIIAGEIALSKEPGKALKKWREIFGISQIELSKALGISPSTISDYEGGRRQSPGIGVVKRFVETILKIDAERGGQVTKQLLKEIEPRKSIFDVREFADSVDGTKFTELIEAKCIANKNKLKEIKIFGYTIIDSIKVIVDVPVNEYIAMYGKTPQRALIFLKVETGRSPMIAVKVGRFSTEMRPAIVVLHGVEKVDPVAIKIAENEKIPLLTTNMPVEKIREVLKKFEVS